MPVWYIPLQKNRNDLSEQVCVCVPSAVSAAPSTQRVLYHAKCSGVTSNQRRPSAPQDPAQSHSATPATQRVLWMSPSATPATQSAAASPATSGDQTSHRTQHSPPPDPAQRATGPSPVLVTKLYVTKLYVTKSCVKDCVCVCV